MKIESYSILQNSIILYFDVDFKQINYVKMESCNSDNDINGLLE